MNCTFCKKPAVITQEYSGKSLCKKHFIKLTNDRIRKNITLNKLLAPKGKIAIEVSGDVKSIVVCQFLKKFSERMPLELYALAGKTIGLKKILNKIGIPIKSRKTKGSLLVTSETLDDVVKTTLFNLLKGKSKTRESVKILKDIPEAEVELYAKLNKLEFIKLKKPVKTALMKAIESNLEKIETKHPGTKFSMNKSFKNLEKVL
jgi:hypothetical protein